MPENAVKGIAKLACLGYVDQMSSNIVGAFDHGTIKHVHGGIREMFKFRDSQIKSHKSIRVVTKDGRLAQSVLGEKNVFRDRFCELLAGYPQSSETLVHAGAYPCDSRFDGVNHEVAFDVIPTIVDVASCFARFKGGKAWGESRVCCDIHKRHPYILARAIYPLILKSYARIQPLLQWKGGVLCEVFKGKEDSSSTKSYRDIC